MNRLDIARANFLAACAHVDTLEKGRWWAFVARDGGYARETWIRQYQAARARKTAALEEIRLSEVACPPRSRPVKIR